MRLSYEDVKNAVRAAQPVKKWRDDFNERFGDFESRLYEELVDEPTMVLRSSEEVQLTPELFERLKRVTLVDRYDAYQVLYDEWQKIAADLEIL